MSRIYLVRHGKAAGSFTDDLDPGLDEIGRAQAEAACLLLRPLLPLKLYSSPLKRAQETAQPLLDLTGEEISIETRAAEIPSPGLSLQERGPWLSEVMQGYWSKQSAALQQWRHDLSQCLLGMTQDTVIFSHFVAINAAVGIAEDDDRVLLFRPDNGSMTILESIEGRIKLVQRGREATTKVN